ncbi:cyclase family protein [Actinoplanes sp. NPDC051494]|uniref:cyclase family protein n=1 Tax=Actinoplanes sp. NPDC051494 TaxID=3363907 RepID=UPI00378AA7D8
MCTENCSRISRRAALAGVAAAAGSLALTRPAPAAPLASAAPLAPAAPSPSLSGSRRGLRDLTYPVTTAFPAYADGEQARRSTYVTIEDDGYYMQQWTLVEHTGTHVDAPGHFIPGGRLSTDLTLDELIRPAVVVDIAARAAHHPDAQVTVGDLRAFERRYARIPRDAAVLMHSGWSAKVGSPDAYRGTDAQGTLHFPGFSADACEWLLEKRAVRSLGVDTLSIDPGESEDFPVHLTLLGADRYGLENLANLHRIPAHGATIVVGLLPFEGGSGGQARIFATW